MEPAEDGAFRDADGHLIYQITGRVDDVINAGCRLNDIDSIDIIQYGVSIP